MQTTTDKGSTGYHAHVHFRAPSYLMPVHAFARRRGLTSACRLRMVVLEALEGDGAIGGQRKAA